MPSKKSKSDPEQSPPSDDPMIEDIQSSAAAEVAVVCMTPGPGGKVLRIPKLVGPSPRFHGKTTLNAANTIRGTSNALEKDFLR